ncbi:hypothetical protein PMZ80_008993 [Knufia obscura]|uniref:Uncharacterized protein n=2 Tax=Knufia TaxID=430999 RepID=A0AAN8ESB7_9EURO|nr:hypothetical protein PMZ80_008993 [Knufia obscura]KAK5955050.1 hypothetical protein OHC33_003729 [Knufia fluminis]
MAQYRKTKSLRKGLAGLDENEDQDWLKRKEKELYAAVQDFDLAAFEATRDEMVEELMRRTTKAVSDLSVTQADDQGPTQQSRIELLDD